MPDRLAITVMILRSDTAAGSVCEVAAKCLKLPRPSPWLWGFTLTIIPKEGPINRKDSFTLPLSPGYQVVKPEFKL